MHVYTRDKAGLRQSVMEPGERKSVWEFVQGLQRARSHIKPGMQPHLWAARQAEMVRDMGMER